MLHNVKKMLDVLGNAKCDVTSNPGLNLKYLGIDLYSHIYFASSSKRSERISCMKEPVVKVTCSEIK